MPKILKDFLKNLSDKDANEIWLYLDGDRYVVSTLIEVIVDNHPTLSKELYQDKKI